ncbi:MAG: DUF4112 domain-containing protein [Pseudomonadota bacterium]
MEKQTGSGQDYDDWDSAMKAFAGLSALLDNKFKLPLVPARFGLDAMLGVVPIIGDGVTATMGFYALVVAQRTKVSFWGKLGIVWNILLDFAFGAIPFAGDLFDWMFQAHRKNLRIIESHIEKQR